MLPRAPVSSGRRAVLRIAAVLTLAAVAASGYLAAGSVAGTDSPSASEATAGVTVSLRKTPVGQVLVSSRGRTLYLFAKDTRGKSACAASCARFWPPLLSAAKPTAGPGVKLSLLGRTKRSNGSMQVTYNGHPLYTYARDTRAGQSDGQGSSGFGARWWAVSARGTAITKIAIETTPPPTIPTIPPSTGECDYPPCP